MTQTTTIHTDGSCLGNPGPGGWAAIIEIPDWKNFTLRGGDPETTNNRMELTAAIEGLRALEKIPGASDGPIILESESKRLCDAFNQGWVENWRLGGWRTAKKRPVKNRDLWEELDRLASGKKIVWQWVKDHAGDPINELCNRIANEEVEAADVHPEDRTEAPLEDDGIRRLGYAQGYFDGYHAARQDMANLLNGMRLQLELHIDDAPPF